MEQRARASERRVFWLIAATAALAVYALIVAWTGGFSIRVAGMRLRSHSWERPTLFAATSAALLCHFARGQVRSGLARAGELLDSAIAARVLVVPAMIWALAAGVVYGTFASGGSDSYGYAGQARLLAHGHLTDTIPLEPAFKWPDAEATLIPLGFTYGGAPGVIAPKYPPGLPLLMAPLTAFSERAIYFLVPVFGLFGVWLVYRIGSDLGDPLAGAVAAILLSVSPPFLYQIVQPMSDVPAMTCWLGALWLASRAPAACAVGAGGLASLAVMIRPNLAPLAGLVFIPAVFSRRDLRWRRALLFGAALAPGLVALGWVQFVRYGSPLASGYGTIEDGFAVANIGPNLARYPRWLTEGHTWFIWLSLLAPFWIARRASRPLLGWIAVLLSLAVWAAYLPYVYFQPDEWSYTRFLLPAIPIMLFFATAAALWGLRRIPLVLRAPAAALLVITLAGTLSHTARTRGAFEIRFQERKYPLAGAFVRDRLPPAAFILAAQHSGSIRYYAGRPTLRWDLLDAAHLDEALATLRARGYQPFAVIDTAEDEAFRRKFEAAGQRAVRGLTPLAALGEARVYGFD